MNEAIGKMPRDHADSAKGNPSSKIGQVALHYLLSILVAYLAMQITLRIKPLADQKSLLIFLSGVTFMTWFSGFGAGLVCTLASAVLWARRIAPPENSILISNFEDIIRLFLFLCVCGLLNSMYLARSRALDALRANQLRLSTVLESSGLGLWDYDCIDGSFWWSDGLKDLLKVGEGDYSPTFGGFLAFVDPPSRPEFVRNISASPEAGSQFEFHLKLIPKSGDPIVVNIRGRAFIGENGRAERMVGVAIPVMMANPNSIPRPI